MNRVTSPNQIAAGYAVAGFTLCLGLYLGIKVGMDEDGMMLIRNFYLMAGLITVTSTFAWGQLRGFPAADDDGRLNLTNVLRNLVMAAIACAMLALVFGPVAMIAVRLAH